MRPIGTLACQFVQRLSVVHGQWLYTRLLCQYERRS